MDRAVGLVLDDLHLWGADKLEDFKERVGEDVFVQLEARKQVRVVASKSFRYVVLGPKGRQERGLHPYYTVEPGAAEEQIMRRAAKVKLEQLGLHYVGAQSRVLRRFEDQERRPHFLAVSPGGHTARSVRRLLQHHQGLLLESQGVLVIATPYPSRIVRAAQKSEGRVVVLKVER